MRAPFVLSCLRDTDAVDSVYRAVLSAVRSGHVLIEHGTFAPELARRISAEAAEVGAAFLDTPVTGGPEGVRTQRLIAMAGGDPDAVDAARPILDAYCRSVVAVGPSGSGLTLKLVNQQLVTTHMAAAAEAMSSITDLGIDVNIARSVLTGGWAASAMLSRSFERLLDGDVVDTGATIAGMTEVQGLVAAAFDARRSAVFATSRGVFDQAMSHGMAMRDPADLYRVLDVKSETGS